MALKRKFNLQVRLFLTLVSLLWVVVITMGILLYSHERNSRREMLTQQLDVFNSVLLSHYSKGDDMKQYLDYMEGYFAGTPLDDMMVAVYDGRTGKYIDGSGYKIDIPDAYDLNNDGVVTGSDMEKITVDSVMFDKDDFFYYRSYNSADSSLFVRTIMPYNVSVSHALTTDAFM